MGGFEVVDPRYQNLFDRAVDVLASDPRVLEVAVSGSIARGTADAWSDLDIQVVTNSDAFDDFLREWRGWLAAITPTVFARRVIAPFIINTVTADGLTFDLAVYAGSAPEPFLSSAEYRVGLLAGRSYASIADALEYAVAEQLRGLVGPFITLLERDESMFHLTGVPHLLGLLTTVFLAESGAPPPGKQWNETYTDEQRATVAALPPVRATRDDLAAFGLGLAQVLVERARPLYP
ncbi:MAG TPA: nucleotidyltransferase domain-containing protein, partial [Acidimicrobiia bacterium]|nr:nucleotidyltransferase domain-containing protein [Acidimicrobiia bacterium]